MTCSKEVPSGDDSPSMWPGSLEMNLRPSVRDTSKGLSEAAAAAFVGNGDRSSQRLARPEMMPRSASDDGLKIKVRNMTSGFGFNFKNLFLSRGVERKRERARTKEIVASVRANPSEMTSPKSIEVAGSCGDVDACQCRDLLITRSIDVDRRTVKCFDIRKQCRDQKENSPYVERRLNGKQQRSMEPEVDCASTRSSCISMEAGSVQYGGRSGLEGRHVRRPGKVRRVGSLGIGGSGSDSVAASVADVHHDTAAAAAAAPAAAAAAAATTRASVLIIERKQTEVFRSRYILTERNGFATSRSETLRSETLRSETLRSETLRSETSRSETIRSIPATIVPRFHRDHKSIETGSSETSRPLKCEINRASVAHHDFHIYESISGNSDSGYGNSKSFHDTIRSGHQSRSSGSSDLKRIQDCDARSSEQTRIPDCKARQSLNSADENIQSEHCITSNQPELGPEIGPEYVPELGSELRQYGYEGAIVSGLKSYGKIDTNGNFLSKTFKESVHVSRSSSTVLQKNLFISSRNSVIASDRILSGNRHRHDVQESSRDFTFVNESEANLNRGFLADESRPELRESATTVSEDMCIWRPDMSAILDHMTSPDSGFLCRRNPDRNFPHENKRANVGNEADVREDGSFAPGDDTEVCADDRHRRIWQVICHEDAYVKRMTTGIVKYSGPFRRYLPPAEHSRLFQNIEKLTKLSEYHLQQLLESATCFNSENDHQAVGRIYSEQVHLMCKAYEAYHDKFNESIEVLKRITQSSKFQTLLQLKASDHKHLQQFLFHPIKYWKGLRLRLKRILETTPDDDSDNHSIRAVLKQMKTFS